MKDILRSITGGLMLSITGGLMLSIGLSASLKVIATTNGFTIATEENIVIFIAGMILAIIGTLAIAIDFQEINNEFDEQIDTLQNNLAIIGVSNLQATNFWYKSHTHTETTLNGKIYQFYVNDPEEAEEYTTITITSKKRPTDNLQTITIDDVYLFMIESNTNRNSNQTITIYAGQQKLQYKPSEYNYLKIKRKHKKILRRTKYEYL